MRRRKYVNALLGLLAGWGLPGTSRLSRTLPQAWSAWTEGDITRARALAEQELNAGRVTQAAEHLLFLCDFVSGEFESALARLPRIAPEYAGRGELTELALDAYVHMNRFADAHAFARATPSLLPVYRELAARHAARPFAVQLSGTATLPFADHALTEYIPGFNAVINGTSLVVHMDTGGSFLIMGPDRARALGIETVAGETSRAHLDLTRMQLAHGIAERFVLGDVLLAHVPVTVLPTLTGAMDLVIFGTCILERFLSTFDYPGKRLLLSRRGDPAVETHRAALPTDSVPVPFFLWGDHFMFARGHVGPHRDLNFFIDSGLVIIQTGADGQPHQAGFTTSARKLRGWGISSSDLKRGFFKSPHPIGLGSLEQSNHYVVTGRVDDGEFGGVRVDGLLSHAFLKQYAWTLDFDRMEYRFAQSR